jgi:hypothetical protein
MKRILLLLSCTSLFGCLYAQESAFGNWLIYFGNKQIDTRWNIHNEVQYRTYDWGGDLEQLMLRTGLGCNLTEKNNNLLLGYGYILSENYLDRSEDKVSVKEHRIFQQFIPDMRSAPYLCSTATDSSSVSLKTTTACVCVIFWRSMCL